MKRVSILLLAFVVGACSTVNVAYDVDKTFDFTKVKTYAFSPDVANLPVQELNRNRIIAAVEKELTARGLSKSDNPDAIIDLQLKTANRQEAYTTSTGGYRGYGWAGGMQTTTIENYVEGSLFISMISGKNLVWQGRGTKTVDENASPEKRESNINWAIQQIFLKYPVKPVAKK